jgi:hypothetical protein
MSTPADKRPRSDNVLLLVQKGVVNRKERERCSKPEDAGESPKTLKASEDDATRGQARTRENQPSSAQTARGVLESPDLVGHAKESENDKRGDAGLEAQDQSAAARRRRAQAEEIDKGYDEKLKRVADNLQALRQEAKPEGPEQSTPLPLDGIVLQRFIQSSDFDPPKRGTNRLRAILPIGIACAAVATIAYYFEVGDRFASTSSVSSLRRELPHARAPASVGEALSEAGQSDSARRQKLEEHARQLSDPPPTAIEQPTEPSLSAQTSSAATSTMALASAPAFAPVEPEPRPAMAMPPVGMDPDEIQLLLKKGQEFLAVGDLAAARVVLRRAAEAGAVAAAFALAQSYDPNVLTQMRVWGVAPDIGEARRWYEFARQMGSAEAARHLELLQPK